MLAHFNGQIKSFLATGATTFLGVILRHPKIFSVLGLSFKRTAVTVMADNGPIKCPIIKMSSQKDQILGTENIYNWTLTSGWYNTQP